MPMPVYTTRRPSIPEPSLPMKAHTETPNMRVRSRSTSPLSSPKVSLCPPVDLLVSRKCRLLTHLSRHANPVSGLIAWKQMCTWMHSRVPADQEDTCPPAKQGHLAHTCHTSPGNAAAMHRAPTAALCAGPHSAPENGLHQFGQKLLELQVPSSSLIPSSREARPCSGPSCCLHVGRSLCLCPLEYPP
ncbi:hypothetical protein VULLAG_LOCUS18746 [Vulpes lagopus]